MDSIYRSKIRVLVIDDSATARAAISDTLHKVGYQVFELPSAIGATRTILRKEIHAVIVDVTMPGLSGDMLVRVLRQNPRLQDLVVVVVSGMSTPDLESIRAESGASAVMTKSQVSTDLPRVLARLLGTSTTLQGAAGARR